VQFLSIAFSLFIHAEASLRRFGSACRDASTSTNDARLPCDELFSPRLLHFPYFHSFHESIKAIPSLYVKKHRIFVYKSWIIKPLQGHPHARRLTACPAALYESNKAIFRYFATLI
jgi:hypothetical protein